MIDTVNPNFSKRWTQDLREILQSIDAGARPESLESETLDFKEDRGHSRDDLLRLIAEAATCFANSRGGTIVVGVADKVDGSAAVVGTDLEPDRVRRRVYELTSPPLLVNAHPTEWRRHRLLVIDVPESVEIHADTRGRATQRIGSACLPMSPADQARLREDRRGIDPSARLSDRSLDDLSPAAVDAARTLLARIPDDRQTIAGRSTQDLLRALRLVDSEGTLLRAADLLLCEPLDADAAAIVYLYRLTTGGEPIAVARIPGPLLTAFRRVLELIAARSAATSVTLPDGQQLQLDDFPELAVREALANAIIHRDHHLAAAVTVEHSPEVLTITSPGPLVAGITPANILTHPSKPRNPRLTGAVRTLDLAEETGRGVDRMYREMLRSGRDIPRIDGAPDQVRVTLVGGAPNTHVARFVAQLSTELRDDVDTMLILRTLCSHRTVRAETLAPLLQKSADEVEIALRRLASEAVEIVEPTRASARNRRPAYRLQARPLRELGAALSYQRRTTDEIDRKVIEHVREYGKITNRTVRNILDVNTERARTILVGLAAREVLVKTSEAQRGPSVEWGPGRRFPGKATAGARRRRTSPTDQGSGSATTSTLFDDEVTTL